jgi:hypothetical protein
VPPNPPSSDSPEQIPPATLPQLLSPPVVGTGGMKVLQPLSNHIVPDSLSAGASESVASPAAVNSPVMNGDESVTPQARNHEGIHIDPVSTSARRPIYKKSSSTPTLSNRVEVYARNDAIAAWLIVIVGLLIIGQAAYSLFEVFKVSSDKDANGFAGIIFSMQALLGFGFIFRVDLTRRILLWLTAVILAFNLYTFLMTAGVIFTLMQTSTGFFVGALSILMQLIMPIAILTVLNLRGVKSAFGR